MHIKSSYIHVLYVYITPSNPFKLSAVIKSMKWWIQAQVPEWVKSIKADLHFPIKAQMSGDKK